MTYVCDFEPFMYISKWGDSLKLETVDDILEYYGKGDRK